MNLDGFFKRLGYDITVKQEFEGNIYNWEAWYRGKVDTFHNYTIYNGVKKVPMERYSVQVAKFISEKMADLLFNERVVISLGNDKDTDTLNDILVEQQFQQLMNSSIEKSFALGTGCITIDIDNIQLSDDSNIAILNESKPRINFVKAENIYPLGWNNKKINEIAIVEYETTASGKKCIIKTHTKNSIGNYIIKTYIYNISKQGQLRDKIYESEFDTKSDTKLFTIIKPNIINNIDMYSPYGISIYANSIDILQGIDIIYDSFINEIQLGRKRLFATKEIMRFSTTTGTPEFNFDPNDVIFYILGDNIGGDESKKQIQEINGALRIDEHIKALSTSFRLLGAKTGFGGDYFTFDEKSMRPKTATQVISENSDLFRTIVKHEQLLNDNIIDIVKALGYISEISGIYHINTDNILVDFDDSIIQSKQDDRDNDRKDLAQDTLSRAEYIKNWRNVDIAKAKIKVAEIDAEKPANEKINFVDGVIN